MIIDTDCIIILHLYSSLAQAALQPALRKGLRFAQQYWYIQPDYVQAYHYLLYLVAIP